MTITTPTSSHHQDPCEPIRASAAIVIPADVDAVFSYLSHLEHNADWNWAIADTTAMFDGPPRRGATYRQSRAFPQRCDELLEIATLRHNEVLEVATTVEGSYALYRYDLEAVSFAATRVTMTLLLHRHTPAGADLYATRLAATMSANLRSLELAVVGRSVPSPTKLISTSHR